MNADHVVALIFSEYERAIRDWYLEIGEALGDTDLLIRSIFAPGFPGVFLPNAYISRVTSAIQSLMPRLRGGIVAILARLTLDFITDDPKLHQRVIPIDRVVSAFGVSYAREMLGAFSSPESANSLEFMGRVKKPFFLFRTNLKSLIDFSSNALLSKVSGPIFIVLAGVIEAAFLVAGLTFTIFAVDSLQSRVDAVLKRALPQTNRRRTEGAVSRVRVGHLHPPIKLLP